MIRRGHADDAAGLAGFARQIFDETFGPWNDPVDMRTYMDEAFGMEQQARELADPAIVTLIAEADGELAGYAQVSSRRVPSIPSGPAPVELMRFYVGVGWQGRGVAQSLMRAVVEEAERLGGATLWLCVWGENARALAFYRKCGFSEIGTTPFQLGKDTQTDLVMARRIDAAE
ncbi:MAG TPA: GNAT family N-acetyltransferase [Gemmatimonadales bacterium]|nr:GNAT family N-acetyltransferase [Gemmatimonadales bacterium]